MATTITNVTELQAMGNNLTEDYVLGNNIDASATSGWNGGAGFIPIGTIASYFTGTFDGKGYTISDLVINRKDTNYVGLFGAIATDAVITDVILSNPYIWGANNTGALVGYVRSTCTESITDCTITGGEVIGEYNVGGLVGANWAITISGCSFSGTVNAGPPYATSPTIWAGDYVGGLAGYNRGPVSSSFSNAVVTSLKYATYTSGDSVGGLIGMSYGIGNNALVDTCYSLGEVHGGIYSVGGLIGLLDNGTGGTARVDNCYSMASVDGMEYVGGLIGQVSGTPVATNSYSTGAVTGTTSVGGLVGNSSISFTNCFWDTETSGQATSASGTGKTTSEMKTITTFSGAGWYIEGTVEDHNDGYPFLHWEYNSGSAIWYITTADTGTRCFTIPDVLDDHGRPPKGALVRAYRADNLEFITEGYLDAHGNATLCDLPQDVDVFFHVTWGGGA